LTESAAIIQYLSETFANSKELYLPNDARSRATLSEWCYFIFSELDAASLYVVRRHEGLKHFYGEAPVAVESAKDYLLHNLAAMASRVVSDGPYLFGDRLSTADVLLMTCLYWATAIEVLLSDTVLHYRERLRQRPAYNAAFKRNFAQ